MKSKRCSLALLFSGFILFVFGVALSLSMVREVAESKQEAIPLAAALLSLERRSALLKAQVEASELHAALQDGSLPELLHVYVLPTADAGTKRLLALFDTVRDVLARAHLLAHLSPVEVSDTLPSAAQEYSSLLRRTVNVSATVRRGGVETLLALFDTAGLLTVADALEPQDRTLILERTLGENPAVLPALQQFLATDLHVYTKEPKAFEERLTRNFSDEGSTALIHRLLDSTRMREVQTLLGGDLGSILRDQKLWPLPFIGIDEVHLKELPDGLFSLELKLSAYVRAK